MDVINDCIRRLVASGGKVDKVLTVEELVTILDASREVLFDQRILLKLRAPISICGDVHGQFKDLLTIFSLGGKPGPGKAGGKKYLFLGDYVDRGKQSIELMALLLAYKVKYPLRIFLLRGNHECERLNKNYGFYDECKRKYTIKIWKKFVDVFNVMPVAATVNKKIFCCHGGLSPLLNEMKDIKKIQRPTKIPDEGLMTDLLWSDPRKVKDWEPNDRGAGWYFGIKQIDDFFEKFQFELIVRAHEVAMNGYEYFGDEKLVTIFSAPYYGRMTNKGAFMKVDQSLVLSMINIPHNYKLNPDDD